MDLYTSRLKKITVSDATFGSGGEGEMHIVLSSSYSFKSCVKIYYQAKRTPSLEGKIRYMVENPPETIRGDGFILGWPLDVIYDSSGVFLGFLMPMAFENSRVLACLTSTKIRKVIPNEWHSKYDRILGDYALLNRLKLINNIAIPIYLLHSTGKYVLKDFKPENVLVTSSGHVTIVDMDSIQIANGKQVLFPATAATALYIPQEFYSKGIGKDNNKILYKSWDYFSIGVVFYQILFGVHPFAVTPKLSRKDDSNEIYQNIADDLFPFGNNSNNILKYPDEHKRFKQLPIDLQKLFILSLSSDRKIRPSAGEWGKAVHNNIQQLSKTINRTRQPLRPVMDLNISDSSKPQGTEISANKLGDVQPTSSSSTDQKSTLEKKLDNHNIILGIIFFFVTVPCIFTYLGFWYGSVAIVVTVISLMLAEKISKSFANFLEKIIYIGVACLLCHFLGYGLGLSLIGTFVIAEHEIDKKRDKYLKIIYTLGICMSSFFLISDLLGDDISNEDAALSWYDNIATNLSVRDDSITSALSRSDYNRALHYYHIYSWRIKKYERNDVLMDYCIQNNMKYEAECLAKDIFLDKYQQSPDDVENEFEYYSSICKHFDVPVMNSLMKCIKLDSNKDYQKQYNILSSNVDFFLKHNCPKDILIDYIVEECWCFSYSREPGLQHRQVLDKLKKKVNDYVPRTRYQSNKSEMNEDLSEGSSDIYDMTISQHLMKYPTDPKDENVYIEVDIPAKSIESLEGLKHRFWMNFSFLEGMNVAIQFVVKADGNIAYQRIADDSYAVSEKHRAAREQIFEFLRSLPKWEPAVKDGKTVASWASFRLVVPSEKNEFKKVPFEKMRKWKGAPIIENIDGSRRFYFDGYTGSNYHEYEDKNKTIEHGYYLRLKSWNPTTGELIIDSYDTPNYVISQYNGIYDSETGIYKGSQIIGSSTYPFEF